MKWGQAKIEFLALRDEIQTALANGKTTNRIHADLKSQNRITMSQRSLYVWLRRERLSGPLTIMTDDAFMRSTTLGQQRPAAAEKIPSAHNTQEDEQ